MNQRKEICSQLIDASQRLLRIRSNRDWEKLARPEQKLPEGEWWGWLILAGRGFGKTRTGAEAVRKLVQMGYRRICLLSATIQEGKRVMIEGESGLLTVCAADKVRYHCSRGSLVWPNGAEAQIFTAENPDSMRGPQFDLAWIDEFMKFDKPQQVWDQLMMTLRIGNPRIIITSTPRPIPILKELMQNKDIIVTRGTTLDNKDNLPKVFLDNVLNQYKQTPFAKQEIYGEVAEESFSLWSKSNIRYFEEIPSLERVIISVDPAVSCNTSSDETGIIVIGKYKENYYIIDDLSMKGSAIEWTQQIVRAYYMHKADAVVIETNQGGDLNKSLLLQIDPRINVQEVRASKSKYIRAQTASILYLQGFVFHKKDLFELEYQMLNFEHLPNSPDRVDALVWGLQFLNQPLCKAYIF